jgi:hypothetical protein
MGAPGSQGLTKGVGKKTGSSSTGSSSIGGLDIANLALGGLGAVADVYGAYQQNKQYEREQLDEEKTSGVARAKTLWEIEKEKKDRERKLALSNALAQRLSFGGSLGVQNA